MTKKLLILIIAVLCIALVFSLSSCNNAGNDPGGTDNSDPGTGDQPGGDDSGNSNEKPDGGSNESPDQGGSTEKPEEDHILTYVDPVKPSCISEGSLGHYVCERCGGIFLEEGGKEIDPSEIKLDPNDEHNYTFINATPATCTEDGSSEHLVCLDCGYISGFEILSAKGHDIKKTEGREPGCLEEGLTAGEYCTRCDYSVPSQSIPAIGHDLTSFNGKPSTCIEAGYESYERCSRCEYNTYTELPLLAHSLEHVDAKLATCTEDGCSAYDHCLNCSYSTKITVPAKGHTLESIRGVEPTCTVAGHGDYEYCSVCSYNNMVEIPAIGHSLIPHEGKAATCTESGNEAYDTCSRCSYSSFKELPALGHSFEDGWTIDIPATEASEGERSRHCSVCHNKMDVTVIPRLPYTDGLKYVLNSNGSAYTVVGAEIPFGAVLNIPPDYKGIPVTAISEGAFKDNTTLKSVIIPDSVISIGYEVFKGCTSLSSLDLPFAGLEPESDELGKIHYYFAKSEYSESGPPSSLKSVSIRGGSFIPTGALMNLTSVESVKLSEAIDSIHTSAFAGCSSLKEMILPATLKNISNGAFSGCSALMEINLPDKLEYIGSDAFASCTGLKSLTVPDSVTGIGLNAFFGCSSVEEITLPFIGENIDDSARNLYYFFGELPKLTKFTLTVGTKLPNEAFEYCTALKTVVLPETLAEIGSYAFLETAIETVKIPNSVTFIGIGAFHSCESLVSVSLPSGLKEIPDSLFLNCSSLEIVNIPTGVQRIGSNSFCGCSGLKELILPSGLLTVDYDAFGNCSSLPSLSFPASVTSIGARALMGCSSLRELTLPFAIEAERIFGKTNIVGANTPATLEKLTILGGDRIMPGTFANYKGLKKLYLPDTITSVEDSLAYAENAVEIHIPSIKAWCSIDFQDESSSLLSYASYLYVNGSPLTSLNDIGGLTEIKKYAFANYSALLSVNIPEGVLSIGEAAFVNCTSLKHFSASESLQNIASGALANCTSLESISLYFIGTENCTDLEKSDKHFLATLFSSSVYYYTDGVKYIPETLRTVEVKGTAVPNGAFSGLYGLTEVILSDRLEYIGKYAFEGCSGLNELVIPDSVNTIMKYAFCGCSSLERLTVPFVNPESYYGIDQWFKTESGRETPAGFPESLKYLKITISDIIKTIPSDSFFETVEVTSAALSISDSAFANLTSLKALTVGGDIIAIGNGAFKNCSSLSEINAQIRISSIGDSAFSGCTKLSSFDFTEGLKSIGANAFDGCTALGTIVLPSTLEYIGSSAFAKCPVTDLVVPEGVTDVGGILSGCTVIDSLTVPTLPSEGLKGVFGGTVPQSLKAVTLTSVNEILDEAFYNCEYLVTVNFPSDITSIGRSAFYNCKSLVGLKIPETVTSFGSSAFANSSIGGNIMIPSGVTVLPDSLFAGCTLIETVSLPDGLLKIGSNVFGNCVSLKELKIPDSVTELNYGVLYNCTALESLTMPIIDVLYYYEPKNLSWLFWLDWSSGNAYSENLKTLTFTKGTEIKKSYLSSIPYLEKVVLPGELLTVGESAFSRCKDLKEIIFPIGVSIMQNAFTHCESLTELILPNGEIKIAFGAFSECTGLKTVVFDVNTSGIEPGAFILLDALEAFVVPNGNEYYRTVDGCLIESASNTLIAVTNNFVLSEEAGIEIIGNYVFSGDAITSITVPEGVTKILSSAFSRCNSLNTLVLPKSLSVIEYGAFYAYSTEFDVFYCGEYSDWLKIANDNSWLSNNGNIVMHYYSVTPPLEGENLKYWHYVNDIPTPYIVESTEETTA